MRDVNRIDGYCDRLAAIWKKYPDLRFGQFLFFISEVLQTDTFFIEDEELFKRLEEKTNGGKTHE